MCDGLTPIGVFWDIENISIPKRKSAFQIVNSIRRRFFGGHREAEFICVCDTNKGKKDVIQELVAAQVCITFLNCLNEKVTGSQTET